MVEMSGDQVVVMVAVRHSLVAARGTVGMVGCMAAAGVRRRAAHGVFRVHLDRMRLDLLADEVLESSVLKVVFVARI